jgi:hypothetical protein
MTGPFTNSRKGLSGTAELAAGIKADSALRDTFVIMLTSMGGWAEFQGIEGEPNRCLPGKAGAAIAPPASARRQGSKRADGQRSEAGVERKRARPGCGRQRGESASGGSNGRKIGVSRADAADGREAVEMVRTLPYDLVLMDCQMPEMNG